MSTLTLAGCSSSDGDAENPDEGTTNDTPDDGGTTDGDATGEDFEEVEFHHSGSGSTGSDGGRIVSIVPTLQFADPVTVGSTFSFTVQNLDTDTQVSLDPNEDVSVDADSVTLFMYSGRGELRPDNAALSMVTVDQEFERVNATLQGDESTFTEPERATYRTTMYREGQEIGATEHEMTIGHRTEVEVSASQDTIEISINAGTLPTGGSVRGVIRTEDNRIRATDTGYNEDAHRFFATFARDEVPSGEQRANLQVTNPDTGRTEFSAPITVEIPEDGTDDETSEEDTDQVELVFSDPSSSTANDGEIVGAIPTFELSKPTTIDGTVSFTTENLDTGNQVTFTVDEETALESTYLATYMYGGDGTLQSQSAHLSLVTPEQEFKRLEGSVEGDETTFSDRERARYRTTMYQDETEVGATEYEMTVGHRTEYEQSISDDIIEVSFNAGTLPTGGSLFGVVRPDGDRVEAEETGYNADTHRFFATFAAADVPPGEHRATIRVTNPSTDRTEFSLPGTMVVPEN